MTEQNSDNLWEAEPHTLAKLQILRCYLDAWFSILYQYQNTRELVYIDACCGPGRYLNGEDGSPVVALKASATAKNPRQVSTKFFFVDHDRSMIATLRGYIENNIVLSNPPEYLVSEAGPAVEEIMSGMERTTRLHNEIIPVFVFIDGWGNTIPMFIIHKILRRPHSEVFVLYSNIDTLRNVNHEMERNRIIAAFGSEDLFKNPSASTIDLYAGQLKLGARYVRGFEMQRGPRSTVHHLFFATNSDRGFVKMKEAMWKIDQWGDLRFSDALSAGHETLFVSKDVAPEILKHELCSTFSGRDVNGKAVREFVELETNYTNEHKRRVLIKLQDEQLIGQLLNCLGEKVRKHAFPDSCIIAFPKTLCRCEQCRIRT